MTICDESGIAMRSASPDRIYPYTVVRIAGGAFEELAALDLVESAAVVADIGDLNARLTVLSTELREELHAAVNGCDDTGLRRALLNAKRALFNGRTLDGAATASLAIPALRLPHLDAYATTAAELEETRRRLMDVFAAEVAAARGKLRTLAGREELLKPLVLSSDVLLEQLRRYLTHDPRSLSAKDLDVERSLLKYLPRMHAKTSPFSLFCHLALGTFDDTAAAGVDDVSLSARRSEVRLNNALWLILRPLIMGIPAIASGLRVRANPTIALSEAGFRFLINVNNLESFQLLPPLEGLEEIALLARDVPPMSELLERVAASGVVDGSADEVRPFVERLIDHGFLEFELGVSASDAGWDRALVALLRPMAADCEPAAGIIEVLQEIRTASVHFGSATSEARGAILRECGARFDALRSSLRAAAGLPPQAEARSFDPSEVTMSAAEPVVHLEYRQFFFEDSALDDRLRFDEQSLRPIAASLARLSSDLTFPVNLSGDRELMRCYFDAKYGTDAAIPLIRFYEDYYRDCKVPEYEASKKKTGEERVPLEFPGSGLFNANMARNREAVDGWKRRLADRLYADGIFGDEIRITPADLEAAFADAPELPRSAPASQAAYVQLFRRDGELMAVSNQIISGFGKPMSRFIHLFEPEVTEHQRMFNLAASQQRCRFVELRDGSVHNANLHPQILDYEIASPGAQTSFTPDRQIPISDLLVSAGERRSLLLTRRSNGERIEVMDLGFQAIKGRSPMFRLLITGFDCATHVNPAPLFNAVAAAWQRHKGSGATRPRIVYDGRIVLQRRGWTIAKEALPRRDRAESDHAYFVRVNEWRAVHEIPPHVFVFIAPNRFTSGKRIRADDYKPQFISFHNWFSIALFERLADRVPESVLIEEMLPGISGMLETADGHHPMELILQWGEAPE